MSNKKSVLSLSKMLARMPLDKLKTLVCVLPMVSTSDLHFKLSHHRVVFVL